jgi:hypothetical protein
MRCLSVALLVAAVVAAAADADSDGVPDADDACPNTPRGSAEHVAGNGCSHRQMDADLDGWCDP